MFTPSSTADRRLLGLLGLLAAAAGCGQALPELPECAAICTFEPEQAEILVLDGERVAVASAGGSVESADDLAAAVAVLRQREEQTTQDRGFASPLLYALCGRDTPGARLVAGLRALPDRRAVSLGGGPKGRVGFASFQVVPAAPPRLVLSRKPDGTFALSTGVAGADPAALLGGVCAPSIQAPCPTVALELTSFTCGQLLQTAEQLAAAGIGAQIGI